MVCRLAKLTRRAAPSQPLPKGSKSLRPSCRFHFVFNLTVRSRPVRKRVLPEHHAILRRDRFITFARRVLEAVSIKDCDVPVLVADQTRPLQHACGDADGGAAHTKHNGDPILGKRQFSDAATIVGAKKPSGEALPKFMVGVASGCLGHLHVEDVRVAQQQITQARRG